MKHKFKVIYSPFSAGLSFRCVKCKKICTVDRRIFYMENGIRLNWNQPCKGG